jgi:hypothetical protein
MQWITSRIAMKRKRGANIAHTIKCLLMTDTEMQEMEVSANWRNESSVASGTINKPSISQPKVLRKRKAPPTPK